MNTEAILCAASQQFKMLINDTQTASVSEDPASDLFAEIICGGKGEFAIISRGLLFIQRNY